MNIVTIDEPTWHIIVAQSPCYLQTHSWCFIPSWVCTRVWWHVSLGSYDALNHQFVLPLSGERRHQADIPLTLAGMSTDDSFPVFRPGPVWPTLQDLLSTRETQRHLQSLRSSFPHFKYVLLRYLRIIFLVFALFRRWRNLKEHKTKEKWTQSLAFHESRTSEVPKQRLPDSCWTDSVCQEPRQAQAERDGHATGIACASQGFDGGLISSSFSLTGCNSVFGLLSL